MMNYNYLEAMTEDIKDYIRNDAELDTNDLLYNRSDLEKNFMMIYGIAIALPETEVGAILSIETKQRNMLPITWSCVLRQ